MVRNPQRIEMTAKQKMGKMKWLPSLDVSDEIALVLGRVVAEGAVEHLVELLDEVLRLLSVHEH